MREAGVCGAEAGEIVSRETTDKASRARQWPAAMACISAACLAGCGGGAGAEAGTVSRPGTTSPPSVTVARVARQPTGAASPQEAAFDLAKALEARNAGAHNASEICDLLSSEGARQAATESGMPASTPCETVYGAEASPSYVTVTSTTVASVSRTGDTAKVRLHYTVAEADASLEDSVTNVRLE